MALTKDTSLEDLASRVDESIAQVNQEAMVCLHQRTLKISHELGEIRQQNEELSAVLKQMDTERENRKLQTFQQILSVSSVTRSFDG
jgi:hypothetical protein